MNCETKVLILGAGYAGVMAALRVAGRTKRLGVSVTLVNGATHFVERPRLPEVAVGKALKQRAIVDMLKGTAVQFKQGWVTKLEPNQQQVVVGNGRSTQTLPYDYLIIALGSRVNRNTVSGVAEFAYALDADGKRDAKALHTYLAANQNKHVAVIGGGATGIEAATEIKGAFPHVKVSLLTKGKMGAFKDARVQEQFREALQARKIEVHEQCTISRITKAGAWLGETLFTADSVVWAGGFEGSPLPKAAGIGVNAHNQIQVDRYLRSLSHPTIYAVGDVAFPVEDCGTPVRMALLPALVMGATAAENIANRLKGKAERPLSFVWYGQALTLGPNDAIGFNTFPADRAVGPLLRGKFALQVRNFFVSFLGGVLEWERRWTGAFYWTGRRRYKKAQKNQELQYDRAI